MPKLIDHAGRRREIIDAAWRAVAADGVGALTLRGVAAEAGIVLGSLRYMFETQDALVADELVAQTRDAVAAGAAQFPKPESSGPRLLALVPLEPAGILRWRVEHALYVGSAAHPRFAQVTAVCRHTRGQECAAIIRNLSTGLSLPQSEIDLEVLRAVALTEGLGHMAAQRGSSSLNAAEAQVLVRRHVSDVRIMWKKRDASTSGH